ncbi:MAG: Trm112 family protein [Armatimonadetes bacterium]|nr:Trm112 family protein [Armatimonadota bacterium]
MDPQLKAILVCPTCHGDLEEDDAKGVLRCQNDGTEFPVRDGIPIMLVDDAKPTGEG